MSYVQSGHPEQSEADEERDRKSLLHPTGSIKNKAIGYIGFGYAEGEDLGALTYEGVSPDAKNIKSGSYPLARHLYSYTWGQPTSCAQKFIDFVLSAPGQKIADDNGFIPVQLIPKLKAQDFSLFLIHNSSN